MVLYCIQHGKMLIDLTPDEFARFSDLFDERIYDVLRPETVVNARNVYGGTASNRVADAIGRAEEAMRRTEAWLKERADREEANL